MDANYWDSVKEDPRVNDLPFDEKRFQDSQRRLLLTSTPEFKQAEKERIERSQVEEHVDIGKGRVWCPIERKPQPEWLCALHHGDRDPSFDVDQEEWEEDER